MNRKTRVEIYLSFPEMALLRGDPRLKAIYDKTCCSVPVSFWIFSCNSMIA